jgi:uncharacterized DUF497 family protein
MDLLSVVGFEWDAGNSRKNEQHGVSRDEIEQVLMSAPLFLNNYALYSSKKERFLALGLTLEGRRMHVTFALREGGKRIRPISARDMSRKERTTCEKAIEAGPEV